MGLEISEVRIKLVDNDRELSEDCVQLLAYASVTFDGEFVVHDIRLVQAKDGIILGMPNRRLTDHCYKCNWKNHLQARFCSYCGVRQKDNRFIKDLTGRPQLYADQAHPLSNRFREELKCRIMDAYELARMGSP